MLPGHDRLAQRLGRVRVRPEHPLVGDRSSGSIGVDPPGHVDSAPIWRLPRDRDAGHVERRMMEAQVQDYAAGRQQDHGKRPAEQPEQPGRPPGRPGGRASAPDAFHRLPRLARGRSGGDSGTVPHDFRRRGRARRWERRRRWGWWGEGYGGGGGYGGAGGPAPARRRFSRARRGVRQRVARTYRIMTREGLRNLVITWLCRTRSG